MNVIAKFKINGVKEHDDKSIQVSAMPVNDGATEEDKVFNEYTPGGNLDLHIAADKPAQEFFKNNVGKKVYLTFSEEK